MPSIHVKKLSDEQRRIMFERSSICAELGNDLASKVYAHDVMALLAHILWLEGAELDTWQRVSWTGEAESKDAGKQTHTQSEHTEEA